jgi:hypothetical protein
MVAFFGERGDRQLDLAQFAAFVAALHAELVRLEFAHYSQGKVCAGAPNLASPVLASHTRLHMCACAPSALCACERTLLQGPSIHAPGVSEASMR